MSKILLLSEDSKIKDPTILSQISCWINSNRPQKLEEVSHQNVCETSFLSNFEHQLTFTHISKVF
jgi:hypothetical protein